MKRSDVALALLAGGLLAGLALGHGPLVIGCAAGLALGGIGLWMADARDRDEVETESWTSGYDDGRRDGELAHAVRAEDGAIRWCWPDPVDFLIPCDEDEPASPVFDHQGVR